MKATRLTSSTNEEGVSAIHGVTVQRTCWWDTTYTAVNWDYPPSLAAYYDALLSRGALHSRFLRIAYVSTRERSSTPAPPSSAASLSPTTTTSPLDTSTAPTSPLTPAYPTSTTFLASSPPQPAVCLPPVLPYSLSPACLNVRPQSANPTLHVVKRRKPQWPKPPHYHASLLRSPLSCRKGLFRAVLPPNQAVDFFRWDILLRADVPLSVPCREHERLKTSDVNAWALLSVAESVLGPYEAATGFFGWHGLGPGAIPRLEGNKCVDDGCCCNEGVEVVFMHGARMSHANLQFEIDEAVVDEGRARWARVAEQLVGPPGLALRWVTRDSGSEKVTVPSAVAHKVVVDSHSLEPSSSRPEKVRWDLDTGLSRPFRLVSTVGKKRQSPSSSMATVLGPLSSGSNPEPETDLQSGWRCGPPPTPHLTSLRLPPPSSVQHGVSQLQFSPWLPPGCVASAQGQGYWYGSQPTGVPSMSRDPDFAKSLSPRSHIFATSVAPTSMHLPQSPRCPTRPNLGWNEYETGRDCDRETETDHGYESTTTTTDSDPPPHTPVGATTSHCVEALQVNGDNGVVVHGVEIGTEHAAPSVTIALSEPTTPVKLLDRLPMSTLPSVSSASPGSDRDGYGSSKIAVVFPSLNGSFRQGSLPNASASLPNRGMSAQTTLARSVTPVHSLPLLSAKESTTLFHLGTGDNSKMKHENGGASSVSGDSPAFTLTLCSPPMSPSPGLRKDSQGFWDMVTPISPSSSSSSFPLLPSESRLQSRPMAGRIGEKTELVLGENSDSSGAASSRFTFSSKSRSMSPSRRRVTSATPTRSPSLRPTSFSSPTSTPAPMSVFVDSHPSSSSPINDPSLSPPNPTTLLPAFLATAAVRRKKMSRTREIVDRLRSSSIDAGKEGAELDSLGWLASPSAYRELDDALGKASSGSDNAGGNTAGVHVTRGQSSSSAPSKSSSDLASRLESDLGKSHGQVTSSKSSNPGSPGSGGTINRAIPVAVPGSEDLYSLASARAVTTAAKSNITPFPILSMSQPSASNYAITHQGQAGGTAGREPVTAMPSKGEGAPKVNATIATSPNTCVSSLQPLPGTPNRGTSASMHRSHHPLPSPSYPTAHLQPSLGPPPPMLSVSPYPPPMCVPFTQYHAAPRQGQQGQGTWLAVYPVRPPHLPVHPLPAQTHIPPITGMSGMRHVSW